MKYRRLVSNLLVIIFLALFAHYLTKHTEDFQSLFKLNPFLLILLVIGYVSSLFMSGLFNKLVIKPFGKHISYTESFRVALLSSIGNYFGPLFGGAGVRAVYLKKKVGLNYTDFASTLYGYYIISFLITAFLGLFSLSFLYEQSNTSSYVIIGLTFMFVASALLAIVFSYRLTFVKRMARSLLGKRIKFLSGLFASWQKIHGQPGLVRSLVRITFINIGIFMLINYLEFKLIGVELGFGALLLYTCLGIFSLIISLTPGALGVREAVYIFSSNVIGLNNSEILAVAVIDRTIQFIVMTLGWTATLFANRWFRQDLDN